MKVEGVYLVGRIKLLSGRILNKLFIKNGLREFNGEQGKILYSLWKKDGISSTYISEETGLALNTLTNMLDFMEKNDLLYRKQCKDDRRKKIVFLTDKGRSLQKKTQLVNVKLYSVFYKNFSPKEIYNFEKSLYKIVNNLLEESCNDKKISRRVSE